MMQELIKCFNCGSARIREGMGKVIDGSWVDDWKVWQTEAWGRWVCSLHCYWEVINEYGWNYIEECDKVC
jgi:hypothetical protein